MTFYYFDLEEINSLNNLRKKARDLKNRHYEIVGYKKEDAIIDKIINEQVRIEIAFEKGFFKQFKDYVLHSNEIIV